MFHFTENGIVQETVIGPKTWPIPELLETPNPLAGEPLAERNAALQKAAEMVSENLAELSETARLHLYFWKNFRPGKISERTYIYPTSATSNNRWELKINELGLFYKDVSGEYDSRLGWVSEQLFSDFWFYGPLQPMPDLRLREKIIGIVRDAFLRSDCPAAAAHFELFEYPALTVSDLNWSEGDHVRRDFVDVRAHGIEIGYLTFRDSEPSRGFLSFENFLHEPPRPFSAITPEIRAEIEQFLGKKSTFGLSKNAPPPPEPPKPPTPREKIDLSESLLKTDPKSERGAETLISLLEFEDESDYWRNYVFNCFFKLRGNRTVENFIIQKLRGDHEIHFKKAVDVLSMWGMYGDKALNDRTLLLNLNWHDATANDPDFRAALEKTIKIINQNQ